MELKDQRLISWEAEAEMGVWEGEVGRGLCRGACRWGWSPNPEGSGTAAGFSLGWGLRMSFCGGQEGR